MGMTTILKLTDQVRDLINNDLVREALLPEQPEQLFVCLDTIEDTQEAIKSFRTGEMPKEWGIKYLWLYGALQATYVQQDAIRHLCECYGLEIGFSMREFQPRSIRNASAGHPTRQDRGVLKPPHYNSIQRTSISTSGFRMMTVNGEGSHTYQDVDLAALFDEQAQQIEGCLNRVVDSLKLKAQEQAAPHLQSPLARIFDLADHLVQKVVELAGGDNDEWNYSAADSLEEKFVEVEAALEARSLFEPDEYFHSELSKLKLALRRACELSGAEAEIHASFLRQAFGPFVKELAGVDKELERLALVD